MCLCVCELQSTVRSTRRSLDPSVALAAGHKDARPAGRFDGTSVGRGAGRPDGRSGGPPPQHSPIARLQICARRVPCQGTVGQLARRVQAQGPRLFARVGAGRRARRQYWMLGELLVGDVRAHRGGLTHVSGQLDQTFKQHPSFSRLKQITEVWSTLTDWFYRTITTFRGREGLGVAQRYLRSSNFEP